MAYVYTSSSKEEDKKRRKAAGEYVKGLRLRVDGLTQAKLAQALGIEYYTFISSIENGANRIPSDKMVAYARALKVNPQQFARRLLAYYDPAFFEACFSKATIEKKDEPTEECCTDELERRDFPEAASDQRVHVLRTAPAARGRAAV